MTARRTPPDQPIPKIGELRDTIGARLAAWLGAYVPGVCDVGGWVLTMLSKAWETQLLKEVGKASKLWHRAFVNEADDVADLWKRFGEASKRANMTGLNRFMKALDFLGAGATAMGDFFSSAKSSWYGKGYDAAVGGVTDLAMGGVNVLGLQRLGGSPGVAVWDTVLEIGAKGGSLSSVVKGVAQGLPVAVTDSVEFRDESLKGTYGLHMRLLAAYTDFFGADDSKAMADYQHEARSGEHGPLMTGVARVGDAVSDPGGAAIRSAETLSDYVKTGNLEGAAGLHEQMRNGFFGPVIQKMSTYGVYVAEQGYLDGFANRCERLFGR